MQVPRPSVAFSLLMSKTLVFILVSTVLNINQARGQKRGRGCCTTAPPKIGLLKIYRFYRNFDVILLSDLPLGRNQTKKSADEKFQK